MSTAQPFPVLASADNSRSASPANSPPPKPAAQRGKNGGRGGGKARGKKSQGSANTSSGEAVPAKRVNGSGKQQQQRSVVAVAGPSPSSSSSSTTAESGLLATADNGQQHKKATPATEAAAAPKRQQPKTARGGRRNTAEPAPAETAPPPLQQQQQQQPIHSPHGGRTGSLPMAMIVAGENGRARVLFNPPPQQDYADDVAADSPPPQFIGQPRFPAGSTQQRRSSMSHYNSSSNGGGSRMRYSSSEGLGLASPGVGHSMYSAPATARCVTTPPEFRQRSMTSTQLRVSAPVFTPQQHYLYQAPVTPVSPAMSREPPMSAPAYDGRGRSQSVSNHVSLTGLRISMAQSRPGNVLAPHLPVLTRASSGGVAGVQTNTYANGGYFATRRASVSNVGLAADLSHSIRIPAVLFQKHAERRSHDATEPGAADAETQEASASGESPAMRRLQEMISSMRALGSAPPTPKSAETPNSAAPAVAAVGEEEKGLAPESLVDDVSLAESSVAQQQAPAAHPTSRFDSILEEDEDADEDEANLDADDGSVTVTDTGDRAALAPKTSALFVV
ncbi:hypothetical protein H4218_004421 [Coemansia sp. IMI 209128]|nr:hypothetical protein H4218_004421 [Coemansia sp. IMI 209128]